MEFREQELGKSECLRGCQYFNIEFLLNARNKDKTVDLNQLVERCGSCKFSLFTKYKIEFRLRTINSCYFVFIRSLQ